MLTPRTFFRAVKAFAGNWDDPETNFYKERSDLTPALSDAALVNVMHEHPILIERPVVRSRKGTRLGRPPERIKDVI